MSGNPLLELSLSARHTLTQGIHSDQGLLTNQHVADFCRHLSQGASHSSELRVYDKLCYIIGQPLHDKCCVPAVQRSQAPVTQR